MKKILFFFCLASILPLSVGLGSAVAEEEAGNPGVHLYLVKNYELIRTLTEGFLEEYRAYGEEDAHESITLALLQEFMIDVVRDIDQTTFAGDLTAEDRKIKAYCHFMLGIVLDRIKNYYRAHFEYTFANKLYPFARIETIDIGGESINFYTEIRRFGDRTRSSENLGTIKFKVRDFHFFSPLKQGVIILDKTTRLPVDPRIIEVVDDRIAMGDTEFETLIPFGIYTIDHKNKDVYIKDFYLIQGMDTVEVVLAPNFWFSLKFDPVISGVKLYSEGVRYWDISYLRYGKYNIIVDSGTTGVLYVALHPPEPQMYGFTTGNRFCRNIVVGSGADWLLYRLNDSRGDLPLHRMVEQSDHNLLFNTGGELVVEEWSGPDYREAIPFEDWRAKTGFDAHSVIADPLFVNAEQEDFRLRPESPALKLGFQPIDVSKIGIRSRE